MDGYSDPLSDIGGIESGAYQLIAHMALSPKKKLLTSTTRSGQLFDLISPRPSSPLLSLTHGSYTFNCTCIFLFFEESSSDALQLTSILSPYGRSQFSIITGHPGEVVPAKAPLFQLISPLWSGTSKVVLINTYLVPP